MHASAHTVLCPSRRTANKRSWDGDAGHGNTPIYPKDMSQEGCDATLGAMVSTTNDPKASDSALVRSRSAGTQ